MSEMDRDRIDNCRRQYGLYLQRMYDEQSGFALTSNAEPTAFARCFGIFGMTLLKFDFSDHRERFAHEIANDIDEFRIRRQRIVGQLNYDKPYLQLLTFSLSALSCVGYLEKYHLRNHLESWVDVSVPSYLAQTGALRGVAGSGNLAMFLAILLIYAHRLGYDTHQKIEQWQEMHLNHINRFGFWGDDNSMSHLQFQNGYHQYEVFDYLQNTSVPWKRAAENVALLADEEGHFAPYPGGGGCYDYDAVFILTGKDCLAREYSRLLRRTANSIVSEQNVDGGFCESKSVRPRSLMNFRKALKHSLAGSGTARMERLRQAITLQRPKYDRINTHWSRYARAWSESDLWDSWFRMLSIARIDCALNPQNIEEWGFIGFPGIGFYRRDVGYLGDK